MKYVIYDQNYGFDDLPVEYERSLFTKLPIYRLTDNSVERLKVSSIKRLLYNIIYESNH